MITQLKKYVAMAAIGGALSGAAMAHTISIGFENAGPGAVTFWFGTYHSQAEAPQFEGTLDLVGVNGTVYSSLNNAFTTDTTTKPAGLIDGTTNFYANNSNGLQATNILGLDVITWQGVTITGLSPGDYNFSYGILPTNVKWAPWNSAVTSSNVTLSGQVTGPPPSGVPDSGTSVMLFGLGLLGIAGLRRFAKKL